MTVLLCVDPAIGRSGATGVAVFEGGVLKAAGIIRNSAGFDVEGQRAVAHVAAQYRPRPDVLVVEWPEIYGGPKRKNVDPNRDILPLAGVVSAVAAFVPNAEVIQYLPKQWKGSLNGDAFTARILTRLSPSELKIVGAVMPESLRHNAIDAAGLGLHYLGRLKAVKVYSKD